MYQYLHQVFQERCSKNQRYSLRAFATSLNVPVTSLSPIMAGKRPISKKFIRKVGPVLNLTEEQIESFTKA